MCRLSFLAPFCCWCAGWWAVRKPGRAAVLLLKASGMRAHPLTKARSLYTDPFAAQGRKGESIGREVFRIEGEPKVLEKLLQQSGGRLRTGVGRASLHGLTGGAARALSSAAEPVEDALVGFRPGQSSDVPTHFGVGRGGSCRRSQSARMGWHRWTARMKDWGEANNHRRGGTR